jgi:hypothetical protein
MSSLLDLEARVVAAEAAAAARTNAAAALDALTAAAKLKAEKAFFQAHLAPNLDAKRQAVMLAAFSERGAEAALLNEVDK